MKKSGIAMAFLSSGVTAFLVFGCGAKKIQNTEVPKQPETNEVVIVQQAQPTELQKYVVQPGDTLWAIAHQSGIYSDRGQWPLIFKTNRDEIKDPDEISPGEVLLIQRGQTDRQIDHAKQLAADTPIFAPHAEPRQPLPLDYF